MNMEIILHTEKSLAVCDSAPDWKLVTCVSEIVSPESGMVILSKTPSPLKNPATAPNIIRNNKKS
jgi:hypothetical protein